MLQLQLAGQAAETTGAAAFEHYTAVTSGLWSAQYGTWSHQKSLPPYKLEPRPAIHPACQHCPDLMKVDKEDKTRTAEMTAFAPSGDSNADDRNGI